MEQNNHYYSIEADSENEVFAKLGETFKDYTQAVILAEQGDPKWPSKLERAKHLLTFVQAEFPEYVEQLQYYAKSAGVNFLDLWTSSLEDDADLDFVGGEHCTSLVTKGANDHNTLLAGHIEDWNLDSAHKVALLRTCIRGAVKFQLYYINTLGGSSITISNGRVQMVDSVRHAKKKDGIPKNIIARYLTDAKDLDAAFVRLKLLPQISGYCYVFVLPDSTVLSVECTADKQVARKVAPPFIHTNHYLEESLQGCDLLPPSAVSASHERLKRGLELLLSYAQIDELQDFMSDRINGSDRSLFSRKTVGRMIVDTRQRLAYVSMTRNNDGNHWELRDVSDALNGQK